MQPWKAESDPVKPPATAPRAAEHLIETDTRIAETASQRDVSSATVACPRKWIEVTLLDEQGAPLVGVECVLKVPDASGAAVTDRSGVARFEGVATDATLAMLHITEDYSGSRDPLYRIEVVPLAPEPAASPAPAPADEDVPYFPVAWDDVLAQRRGED